MRERFLTRMAAELRVIGHGGIVIVSSDLQDAGVGQDSGNALTTVWEPWPPLHFKEDANASVEYERNEARVLRDIARLTAVDGALITHHERGGNALPSARRFGAKIIANEEPKGLLRIDATTGTEDVVDHLSELGGTRHQSAACCAASGSANLVLVVSQDGRCSLARKGAAGQLHVLVNWHRAWPRTMSQASFVRRVDAHADLGGGGDLMAKSASQTAV